MLLDARPLQGDTGRRGVGAYVREVLRGMIENGRAEALSLLTDPRGGALVDPPNLSDIAQVPAHSPPGPVSLWGKVLGPRWLAGHDLWHATFLAPPRVPSRTAYVATVHDLIPLDYPGFFSRKTRTVFSLSLRHAATAQRIITVSRHTADSIMRRLGVPASKIVVIAPPVAPLAKGTRAPVPAPCSEPYILHSGGFDPLKGVTDRLIPAFAQIARRTRDLHLVLVGAPGRGCERARACARDLGVDARIVFTGYLDAPAYRSAIDHASAMVVSSSEEGFGIPVVEALAAGIPLAIGPASAPRETAGELASCAEGDSAESMARAIDSALKRGGRESAEANERRLRARDFEPSVIARRIWQVYEQTGAAGFGR